MLNTFFIINHLFIKLTIHAFNFYIQTIDESTETKKIGFTLKNYFNLLENSILSNKYENLTDLYAKHSFLSSIHISLLKKNKKTNTIILNSKILITESSLNENLESLNFIIKNIEKFLEKKNLKFYLQKTQKSFLTATTKEKECPFKPLLHLDPVYPICYIYNPFFTFEVCPSTVKIIVNYNYSFALLIIEYNFNNINL